ncbi:enoyl-CoA hydratase-related protein [Pseudomonadota bacterium]|nr:enoyl-CoA hydratase-related protein [Pseudomonadota bacterium]
MSFDTIIVEKKGKVTRIVLNRPESLNAINPQMHQELQSAFDDFANDSSQWLAVLEGAGQKAFCAGSDLKAMARADDLTRPYPLSGYGGLVERYDLFKPIIAAVDGYAVGGGFELALACDLIIATSRSTFGLPEPLIGAVAVGGGVHRLSRQIGLKQAMGLILSGRNIPAKQAFDLGVVTQLVEPENFEDSIQQWCSDILRCAPLAIQASKEAVMKGLDESDVKSAITAQESYPIFSKMQNSNDRREGPKAFSEKRLPKWSGD